MMVPTLYPPSRGAFASSTTQISLWHLLIQIWFRPRRAFKAIAAGPGWLWAIPLGCALAIFYARTFTAALVGAPIFSATLIGGLGGILGGWLLRALLLHAFAAGLGGRPDFGLLYRTTAWAAFPLILRDAVQMGAMLATGRPIAQGGLAFLVTEAGASAGWPAVIARIALERTDLYTVWFLALLAGAVAVAARLARGKALLVVACYGLLSLAVISAAALVNVAFLNR
ncbi:MAG: YIP1 family protein [Chloroflexi bacterium]|nr:YIP1 family protein [Chloroflexota bacterium]